MKRVLTTLAYLAVLAAPLLALPACRHDEVVQDKNGNYKTHDQIEREGRASH